MPVCCNYIQVGLYVFFVGVLRVRRAAASLVSLHLFCPCGLNCCCIQQTSVFQTCCSCTKKALSVSIRNFHLSHFRILSQQSPLIWPCFWAAGPTEEQTAFALIYFYKEICEENGLTLHLFVYPCWAACCCGSLNRWNDWAWSERAWRWLGGRWAQCSLNEKGVNYNIQPPIIIM